MLRLRKSFWPIISMRIPEKWARMSAPCADMKTSPRVAFAIWDDPPFEPGGAGNAKAADSSMISKMSFMARTNRPCGEPFLVGPFLAKHPEFAWEKPVLRDMQGTPWAMFRVNDHASSAARAGKVNANLGAN